MNHTTSLIITHIIAASDTHTDDKRNHSRYTDSSYKPENWDLTLLRQFVVCKGICFTHEALIKEILKIGTQEGI